MYLALDAILPSISLLRLSLIVLSTSCVYTPLMHHLTTAMSVAKQTFVIAGLPVNIFTERSWTERSGDVAILFFLHGRNGTAKSIQWVTEATLKHVAAERKKDKSATELIIVTFVSNPC